jgi:hypothetical protein
MPAMSARLDPLLYQVLRCARRLAQFRFGPEARRLGRCRHLGPSQAHASVLSQQVGPAARQLAKLGHGLILVLNAAAGAAPAGGLAGA